MVACLNGRCHTGIDTFGAALWHSNPNVMYRWACEGCPLAIRAHRAFWSALGQSPRLWPRAEDPALADAVHHVDIEFLTLRCVALARRTVCRQIQSCICTYTYAHVHGHVCCACICARCAPFSAKNRMYPANCYAAVRELREVLLGVQRRAPHCCIYENTAGKLAAQLGRVGGAHYCTILPMWCCVNVH